MKFKIGDKVKFGQIGGVVTNIKLNEFSAAPEYLTKLENGNVDWITEGCLELLSDGWQQGDVLVREDGGKFKIEGVCGNRYFLSSELMAFTKEYLENRGYKPLSETPVLEVTLEQVAEKFGVKEIIIK